MADRAVGAHVLIALIDSVVGPCQEKKVAAPILSDVDLSHIFREPRIQLVNILRRFDRPFFNITDDVLCRRRRLQPQRSQPFAHSEHLVEGHRGRGFPTTFTHSGSSLPPASYRAGLNALCSIMVSPRYRSISSFRVSASNCCTSSLLNQTTVSRCAPSTLLVVELWSPMFFATNTSLLLVVTTVEKGRLLALAEKSSICPLMTMSASFRFVTAPLEATRAVQGRSFHPRVFRRSART